jgi:hypothetical protein
MKPEPDQDPHIPAQQDELEDGTLTNANQYPAIVKCNGHPEARRTSFNIQCNLMSRTQVPRVSTKIRSATSTMADCVYDPQTVAAR